MSSMKLAQPAASATGSGLRSIIARHPLVAYFILAFLGSWIVWLPMVLAGNNLLLPSTTVSPGLRLILSRRRRPRSSRVRPRPRCPATTPTSTTC